MDVFPVLLSFQVSLVATLLTLLLGLPVAWVLARRRFPGHDLVEAAVVLPLVLPPTVLAFCRALGDFGITLMVAGSIPGLTQTMPLAIYDYVQANQMREANLLSLVAVMTALLFLVGLGRLARLRF